MDLCLIGNSKAMLSSAIHSVPTYLYSKVNLSFLTPIKNLKNIDKQIEQNKKLLEKNKNIRYSMLYFMNVYHSRYWALEENDKVSFDANIKFLGEWIDAIINKKDLLKVFFDNPATFSSKEKN